jgi:chromosome segregation ATPase
LFEKTANSILEAEKRIETLEEKAGFLDARIVDSTAELDSKIAQIGLLANSAEARILELGNANKELLSRLNDIGGRIGVMELLLTGINDRVVALEKRVPSVADFETSLKSALSGIETLGNSVGRLEISLATVENSLAELADAKVNQIDSEKIEKEIASLRENLGGLSMSFIRLNSDLIQLRDSIPPEGVSPEQFSNKTYEIDMRIGSLESDLVSIEARISGLNAVLSNLDKKLQSLGVELDSIKGNFDGSVTAIDNNLRSIQRLQTDLNGLKELVAENKENLKALREETAELLVTREEIASIVDEAVKSVREETTQEIAALRRSNSIWLAVAVISSIAAIVLGVINIMP